MTLTLENIKWIALLILSAALSVFIALNSQKSNVIDSLEAKIRLMPFENEKKALSLKNAKLEKDYKALKKQFDFLLKRYKNIKDKYLELHQPTRKAVIQEAEEAIKQLKKNGKLL